VSTNLCLKSVPVSLTSNILEVSISTVFYKDNRRNWYDKRDSLEIGGKAYEVSAIFDGPIVPLSLTTYTHENNQAACAVSYLFLTRF
jgi:hypothetical protein